MLPRGPGSQRSRLALPARPFLKSQRTRAPSEASCLCAPGCPSETNGHRKALAATEVLCPPTLTSSHAEQPRPLQCWGGEAQHSLPRRLAGLPGAPPSPPPSPHCCCPSSSGCTLCLGQSTFLRFNHPAEAKWMKSRAPGMGCSPASPPLLLPGKGLWGRGLAGIAACLPQRLPFSRPPLPLALHRRTGWGLPQECTTQAGRQPALYGRGQSFELGHHVANGKDPPGLHCCI